MRGARFPAVVPTLDAGAVLLRPLRPEDAEAIWAYWREPAVAEPTGLDVGSVDDVRPMLATIAEDFAAGRSVRWALTAPGDTSAIGTCRVYAWSLRDARAEIGYDLAPAFWGRGIMSDVVRCVLAWAAEECGLHRIEATVLDGNERSARLLERTGFVREAVMRDHRLVRGAFRDVWLYARILA